MHELFSDEVEATVPRIVRETVEAIPDSLNAVSGRELAELLRVHPGTVSRRVEQAIALGYIVNDEWRAGHPARYRRGNPLPDELVLLPTAETLRRRIGEEPDDVFPRGGQADTSAEAITPETINGLIDRMPELALWPREEVERLAPDLLSTEAEAKAERQHRDPTD